MQKFNVVFLDVDGVLNNIRAMIFAHYGLCPPGPLGNMFTVDRNCVIKLRELVEKYKLKIVVSSTWRFHPHALVTALEWCNWFNPPIIGKTDRDGPYKPVDNEPWGRGAQIDRWLAENQAIVNNYVILDDDITDIHQKDHLVATKTQDGLQTEHIKQIKVILGLV